ncbi:hypothetical protein BJX63DRAFT_209116 [Aspergillus granulosus]|uniref:Uncharacterized protein n=1 Tax=Aspergillus granulosus TaxID=176169 RepID=A0ABR4HEJ2_9EURO
MENQGQLPRIPMDLLQQAHLEGERGVDPSSANSCPVGVDEDIFFDWDALYGGQVNSPAFGQGDRISWSTFDSLTSTEPSPTPFFAHDQHIPSQSEGVFSQDRVENAPVLPSNFNNVAEWLDGAYRPPKPCDHCRRYRLQCLILRRTSDNPNPVPSCSSCVGLFRPCSFGRGEKRQASRFETLTPVMGHLHGLPEEAEASTCANQELSTGGLQKLECRETKQFVRKGARVLRDWFYRNEDYPYPSEEEKARLEQETGFSRQRISTWFANARRRYKQQRQVGSSARIYRAGSPMPTRDTALMTPMERWQSSPPDEEPVSEAAIQDAIASTAACSDGSPHKSRFDLNSPRISSEGSSLASSLSSFNAMPSDASDSSSSAWSYQSGEGPLRSRPYPGRPSAGRRGRKPAADDRRYQCTFCLQSFKKKHDWSRHEKSVHLPLDVWVCTPTLSELEPSCTPVSECRFCEHQTPTQEHWESHDFQDCATKPMAERSFSRKDYLWQHLRKFHGCTRYPVPDLDAWHAAPSEIQSRCGFCPSLLHSWTARADHLATHFKEGCRMSQWVGDWGFDSTVLASLRNAVLPIQRGLLEMAST